MNPALTPEQRRKLLDLAYSHGTLSLTGNGCYRSPDGSCSGCGGCCERVLPLEKGEAQRIKRYLSKHPEIKKRVLQLNKGMPLRMCPFMDYTKPGPSKCMLYDTEVLPLVCKLYTCDLEERDRRYAAHGYDPKKTDPQLADMWHTFFYSATRASDISHAWFLKEIVKSTGHLPVYPDGTLVTAEDLPKYFETYPWIHFFTNYCGKVKLPPGIRNDREAIQWYLELFQTLKKQHQTHSL